MLCNLESVDKYTEFFGNVEQLCRSCNIEERMRENNIVMTEKFNKESIALVSLERGGAVATYRVYVSRFVMNIRMLNMGSATQRHSEHNIIDRGAFGMILELPYAGQQVVGKRIEFSDMYEQQNDVVAKPSYFPAELKEALMEYSILKVCSALGIAPVLIKEVGFDVVRFARHIEFYMEMCGTLEN